MGDSPFVACSMLALGPALAVGARRPAGAASWRSWLPWRGSVRLSPYGQRLVFLHLELGAGILVAAGLQDLLASTLLGIVFGWLVVVCLGLNSILVLTITGPASFFGVGMVDAVDQH